MMKHVVFRSDLIIPNFLISKGNAMKKWIFIHVILFLVASMVTLQAQDSLSVQTLLKQAKQLGFNQQWNQATQTCETIVDSFPDSPFFEEALFWLGFCYEKQDSYHRAFDLFDNLAESYPQSPWTDDAVQHQILIAEDNYDQPEFKTFLYDHLRNQDSDIRLQAAIALGKNGDKRAVPVLKVYQNLDEQAKTLVQQLTREPKKSRTQETASNVKRSPKDRIVYFPEDRFELYKQLVKNENTWRRHELVLFGMWQIMTEEAFDSLYQKPMNEQKKTIDLYWKYHDPTPTTLKNEAQQEFNVRVLQAHKRFSYYDNLENFYYAPWDARGELLIKYGAPDHRKTVQNGEIWKYNNVDQITFFVRFSVTNIFGRAIFIHRYHGMDLYDLERSNINLNGLYEDFVFEPRFYFDLNQYYDLITDLKLVKENTVEQGASLSYSFPVHQMAWVQINDRVHIEYDEHVVVYDDDLIVMDQNLPCHVSKADKTALAQLDKVHNIIVLSLEPGNYTVGLRVSDRHSDKVGIAKREISIIPKR